MISISWHHTMVTIVRYPPRQANGIGKSIKQVYQGISFGFLETFVFVGTKRTVS